MAIRHVVSVMVLSTALAGCALVQRAEQEKRNKELIAQSDAAGAACKSNFTADDRKTYLARQRCLNDAVTIAMPALPDQDLVSAYMAERVAIGEQVQAAKMTVAQGDAAIADKRSWMVSESENRRNARVGVAAQVMGATAAQQSAAAQQQAASASAMRALNPPMTPPVTCTTMGNSTTCH